MCQLIVVLTPCWLADARAVNDDRASRRLIKFDIDGIRDKGYDMTIPVVITNSDDLGVKTLAEGEIVPGTELLKWE